jgi:hypothetical protein
MQGDEKLKSRSKPVKKKRRSISKVFGKYHFNSNNKNKKAR